VLFDTRAKLGGFYVEVLSPARIDATSAWSFPT
jgi:hypothetical protein